MGKHRALFAFPIKSLLMKIFPLFFCLAFSASAQGERHIHKNQIPPRWQWNANSGYCGETSFISAGLYYGQYCSQYTARKIASPGIPQSSAKSQLLLGVNDRSAARAMRLQAEQWHGGHEKNTHRFLVWVKNQVQRGYPVIIGVFNNEYLLYGNANPSAGDPAYDHIVPVFEIGSERALNGDNKGRYFPSDSIRFSDNGLWGTGRTRQFDFRYRFGAFQKNRAEANARDGAIYSLNNDGRNFGVAITGVADRDGDTIPVRLHTNVNYERPEMRDGSNRRPSARPLTLTAVVTIPDRNSAYNLYLYEHFEHVPDSKFNQHANRASRVWHIPAHVGGTYRVKIRIQSDEVAVFRAVRNSAP